MFWCTGAEARIQGIADAGARTLISLDWRWTPPDSGLDNGIRCMMASSASKSYGILDMSPAAIFTRSASNLSRSSQVRGWCASASLAQACAVSRGPSQHATQARRYMEPLRATLSWLWYPTWTAAEAPDLFQLHQDSVTFREFPPWPEHDVRPRCFAKPPAFRTPERYPRDALCSSTFEAKRCAHVTYRQKCWSPAIASM